jgi:hypothetical protein
MTLRLLHVSSERRPSAEPPAPLEQPAASSNAVASVDSVDSVIANRVRAELLIMRGSSVGSYAEVAPDLTDRESLPVSSPPLANLL